MRITARQKRILLPAVLLMLTTGIWVSLLGSPAAILIAMPMALFGGWLTYGIITEYGDEIGGWFHRDGWK